MPQLLTENERLELQIAAYKKEIAEKEEFLKTYRGETRRIEMETMKKEAETVEKEKVLKENEEEKRKIEMFNMKNNYGVKPVTGQKRQMDEVQTVEASSSEEQRCCGCRSCKGPWASDGEEADEENDDGGDEITAASSKNK